MDKNRRLNNLICHQILSITDIYISVIYHGHHPDKYFKQQFIDNIYYYVFINILHIKDKKIVS